jgi:hypothetical protein
MPKRISASIIAVAFMAGVVLAGIACGGSRGGDCPTSDTCIAADGST